MPDKPEALHVDAGADGDTTSIHDAGRPSSISFVIPVYNEEDILRETVAGVEAGAASLGLTTYEIILCENGSTDRTRALADDLVAEMPHARVLYLDKPDYGAAMRAGFLAAQCQAIVNFDADYFDMDFVDRALELDADIVVAAKQILGSHDARVLSRRVVSRCFGWMVQRLLGVSVRETHGIKMFRRASIAPIVPQVISTKDLFDTELLAYAEHTNLVIAELPIHTKEIRHSRSGIIRRIPRTVLGLVRLRRRIRRYLAAQASAPSRRLPRADQSDAYSVPTPAPAGREEESG